jgi:hypothetical protein
VRAGAPTEIRSAPDEHRSLPIASGDGVDAIVDDVPDTMN